MSMDRLQKILARAGVASRRAAEDLLREGRVRVNGEVASLGQSADAERDLIELDGKRIRLPRAWTYIILYKPEGVVTTASDEYDRRNVIDLIKGVEARIYPVGRLDLDAEGLLLLTNDGDMTTALTHPAGEVPKTYRVKARGQIAEASLDKLRQGVILEDGPARATFVHRIAHRGPQQSTDNTWIELTVTEGRNHLVKRMLESIGHPVVRLRRMTFANLDLAGLRPGDWRNLRRDELHKLKGIARTAARRRAGQRVDDDRGGERRARPAQDDRGPSREGPPREGGRFARDDRPTRRRPRPAAATARPRRRPPDPRRRPPGPRRPLPARWQRRRPARHPPRRPRPRRPRPRRPGRPVPAAAAALGADPQKKTPPPRMPKELF
ncbi:MAG: pseudouridine synthase [bacterium]